jgi:predicted hotdog family 3-hydroxylacyl-ACP dehydratase
VLKSITQILSKDEGNVPATLFLGLAVAISVYFALFSRHLIGHNAGSYGVLIGARQALFSLSH